MKATHISSRKFRNATAHDVVQHYFTLDRLLEKDGFSSSNIVVSMTNDDSVDPVLVWLGSSDDVEAWNHETLATLPEMCSLDAALRAIGVTESVMDANAMPPRIPESASLRRQNTFRPGDVLAATADAGDLGLAEGERVRIVSLGYRQRMTLETIPYREDEREPRLVECSVNHPGVRPTRYRWTVEIEIAANQVADGAELTDERMASIMEHAFSYAYSHELGARVVSAPDAEDVSREQGYKSAADRAAREAKRRG